MSTEKMVLQDQLVEALSQGNLVVVAELEKQGASFLEPGSKKITPFAAAVYSTSPETLKYVEEKLAPEQRIEEWRKIDVCQAVDNLNAQLPANDLPPEPDFVDFVDWFKKQNFNPIWQQKFDRLCLDKMNCVRWQYDWTKRGKCYYGPILDDAAQNGWRLPLLTDNSQYILYAPTYEVYKQVVNQILIEMKQYREKIQVNVSEAKRSQKALSQAEIEKFSFRQSAKREDKLTASYASSFPEVGENTNICPLL